MTPSQLSALFDQFARGFDDFIKECGSLLGSDDAASRLESFITASLRDINTDLNQIREMIMALATEVQALLDAVTAQGVAITAAVAELTTAEAHVADLQSRLATLSGGAMVDPEDLAAIVQATNTISSSIATIKAAMPQPVPQPVVAAVADMPQAGAI